MMLNSQHTKWLTMSPNVIVDIIDDSLMLLYNTHGGIIKISRDEKLITLIKVLYTPKNLGVVKYEIFDKYNSLDTDWAIKNGVIFVLRFIDEVMRDQLAGDALGFMFFVIRA